MGLVVPALEFRAQSIFKTPGSLSGVRCLPFKSYGYWAQPNLGPLLCVRGIKLGLSLFLSNVHEFSLSPLRPSLSLSPPINSIRVSSNKDEQSEDINFKVNSTLAKLGQKFVIVVELLMKYERLE
jgi:hypothetical protein